MNTYLYNAKHTLPDKFKEFSPSNGWEHMKVFVSLSLNTS